jgi:hypothetical protein
MRPNRFIHRNPPPSDPWQAALRRHFAPETDGRDAPQARAFELTRGRAIVAGGLATALLAGIGFLGFAAWQNHDRADRWRDRSEALEELVGDRTAALNRQTARLNVASTRLRKAKTAVRRSEEDVAALEVRQEQLAAEKAAVEDERAELLGIASDLDSCNVGLAGLIDTIAEGYEPYPSDLQYLASVCSSADRAVESYLQTSR